MTNYERLRGLSKVELARELQAMRSSDALAYIDFNEWLESDNQALLPKGKKVIAQITQKNSSTQVILSTEMVECIIVSDKKIFFGSRYYTIFDLKDKMIKSVPFENFEVIGYE